MARSEQMEAYSQFWSLTLGFAAPFARKAAVKLDIFNIVSKFSSEQGATLDETIQELRIKHDADSIQAERLFRLLSTQAALSSLLVGFGEGALEPDLLLRLGTGTVLGHERNLSIFH
ncbi:hypothetical protein SELMODRAFT_410059 [Selaginella moellendorffii]|uniref:O-methyltransferase dimerisation domain-containing protein n=1 Tax=Selaginella moellendorffii TaxID=88036 RepID=D8RDC3_SELML|nr:hypothetical protein SELMODRAFT_410059 [Selaginella moellendorffii]